MGIWTVWRAGQYEQTKKKIELNSLVDKQDVVSFYISGKRVFGNNVSVNEDGNVFCVISPSGKKSVVVADMPVCTLRPVYGYEAEKVLEEDEGFRNEKG